MLKTKHCNIPERVISINYGQWLDVTAYPYADKNFQGGETDEYRFKNITERSIQAHA